MSVQTRLRDLEQLAAEAARPADIDLSRLTKEDWLAVRKVRQLAAAQGRELSEMTPHEQRELVRLVWRELEVPQ